MSLYGIQAHICGVPCAMVLRGAVNGRYQAVFEREQASLEDIEAIDWARPAVEGDCLLPTGCGFTVEDISYASATRSYTVSLKVGEQFLGDVAGFQAQVDELTAEVAAKTAAIQEQEQTIQSLEDQLAEADEALIALYEAGAAPAEPEGTEPAGEGETV